MVSLLRDQQRSDRLCCGVTILATSEESFFFSSTRVSISFIRFPISSVILAAVSLSALRRTQGAKRFSSAPRVHAHTGELPPRLTSACLSVSSA